MKSNKSICLLFLLLALNGWAGTNAVPVRFVTLRECIEQAVQHNLQVQMARRGPAIARYNVSAAYGAHYDPVFTFSAIRDYVDMPGTFDPKKSGSDFPYEQTLDTLSTGVSGRLTPGLSYDLVGSSTENAALTQFGTISPFVIRDTNNYVSTLSLNLKQSLLKDFWINSDLLKIQVSKKALRISEQALRQQLMATVYEVQVAYYDLAHATENVKVMKKALELATELVQEDKRRVLVGAMVPQDEKYAESLALTAQANLLEAEDLLESRQNALRGMLIDNYAKIPKESLVPGDALVVVKEQPDRAECVQTALENRPELLEAKLEVEKQGLIVRYTRNQMFPSLDLVGAVGSISVDTNSRSGTFDPLFDFSHPAYTVGVVLKIPLSNKAARNAYHASQETKEQAVLNLRSVEQNIVLQLDDVIASLEKTYKRVSAARLAREFAEAALEAEKKKLAADVTTSFLVSEHERNLIRTRTAEILAMAQYNKAQAKLAYNQGIALAQNQIKLNVR